jgi:hypothetical protein
MRNLPISWRTLGYINNLSLIYSSAKNKNYSKAGTKGRVPRLNIQDHRWWQHSLKRSRLVHLTISLKFEDEMKRVNLRYPHKSCGTLRALLKIGWKIHDSSTYWVRRSPKLFHISTVHFMVLVEEHEDDLPSTDDEESVV